MPENENQKSNGLAIASFVLALVGGFLCLTVIGGVLGIICRVLAIIFGIIALCKNQTKRAGILGIVLSCLGMLATILLVSAIKNFVVQHKDQIVTPVANFSARIDDNPELVALMDNEEFSNKFEVLIKQRLQEKYGDEYSDIDSIEGALDIFQDLFEEMQNLATELAVGLDTGSETSVETHICGDFYKTEEEIICTQQYEPVCGDNGQTYGNSCFACIEVDSYTDGECAAVPAPSAKLRIQEGQTEEETQAMIEETCTNAGGALIDGNCTLEDGTVIAF